MKQLFLLGGPVAPQRTRAKTVRGVLKRYIVTNEADRGRVLNYYNFPLLVMLENGASTTIRGNPATQGSLRRLSDEQIAWMDKQFGHWNWYSIGSGIWFTNESFRAMFILQWSK